MVYFHFCNYALSGTGLITALGLEAPMTMREHHGKEAFSCDEDEPSLNHVDVCGSYIFYNKYFTINF